jgi:hypothetical protein
LLKRRLLQLRAMLSMQLRCYIKVWKKVLFFFVPRTLLTSRSCRIDGTLLLSNRMFFFLTLIIHLMIRSFFLAHFLVLFIVFRMVVTYILNQNIYFLLSRVYFTLILFGHSFLKTVPLLLSLFLLIFCSIYNLYKRHNFLPFNIYMLNIMIYIYTGQLFIDFRIYYLLLDKEYLKTGCCDLVLVTSMKPRRSYILVFNKSTELTSLLPFTILSIIGEPS